MTREEVMRHARVDEQVLSDVRGRAEKMHEALLHDWEFHDQAGVHLGMTLGRLRRAIYDLDQIARDLRGVAEFVEVEDKRLRNRRIKV